MDKVSFIKLWDIYSGLLTATQQEITDMYVNLDLTVSEIAAEKNITRQAVSECLKGCKNQFEEYEAKLHVLKRLEDNSFKAKEAGKWAENFKRSHPEFSKELDGLLKILSNNV